MPAACPRPLRTGGSPATALAVRGSGLLLVDHLWEQIGPQLPGELIAAVPSRDMLAVTGSQVPGGIAALTRCADAVWQQSTTRLLWTTPGLLEAPQPGEDGAMSNPRYTAEMRERAVKMVMQVRRESGQEKGAVARVAQQLGIGREALRGWVAQAEVDSGARPGTTSDDKQRIKELERENSELRRANEILKAASAYFARELGPSLPR